jgi:Carboxypeptidase regulatory-like domain/TonB-dependent Receptor Plug Domain/TonB dependent receptor
MVKGRALLLCLLVLPALVLSPAVRAQVSGGTLSGTVSDASGGGIAQAHLVIKNVATAVERTVTTNDDGFYTVVNLQAGSYELTISATDFNTELKSGITVTVGGQQTFDVVMHVGTVSNRVEVTTQVPTVQLASSDISAVVDATTVRELPLNGRSWTDLAALQPGVSTIQTQPSFASGSDRGNRGFGQELTISGARPQQNNYRLDGVSLNDYANGAPGSVLGGNLGVDAIQEFSVLTSNYSAEYGKSSGGVINAITRSGTNEFHGSVYEFLRNSALDAKNFFESNSTRKAPFKRNQFGGTIGGPIIKDRTFFFADFESNRQSKGIANIDFVPSPAARNGNLQGGSVVVDPLIQQYLALYPVPAACGGDVCPYNFNGQQVVNENFITTHIEHRFSDKDNVIGTYLFDRTPYSSPDAFGNVGLATLTSRQIAAIEETHSFSTGLVNAIRFGFNHENVNNNASSTALNPAAANLALGVLPNRNASILNVGGMSSLSGGVGALVNDLYDWNSFQGYDDAFLTLGKHSIKFGGAVEAMQLKVTDLTDLNGVWFFQDLAHLLQNQPSKFNGGVVSSVQPRNLRQTILGGYLQDDWHWKPNVTLNLGLRYEMATVPTETNGLLVNLRNITDPLPICGRPDPKCAGTGPLFTSNPTLDNFEPRLGFAWDPFKNGRMAVRGGAGLFDVLPLPYQFFFLETQAVPFFQYLAFSSAGAPAQPLRLGPLPSADFNTTRQRSTYVESAPKRNYVSQWNLNVQYSLTPNLTAMIAYVGSRGVHQPFRVDEANLALPTKTSAGYLWPQVDAFGNAFSAQCNSLDASGPADPASCAPPPVVNPAYSSIRGLFYKGRSYYNSLELQLSKRMSHGFQVQGAFTWGRSIDTSSATLAGDAFGNSISSLNYFDTRLTRGLSDFNVGRTLVINGIWDVPSPKSWTGPAHWLADGWEFGTILTVSDGVPFTPTWGTGSDPAFTQSQDDYAFLNASRGPGCQTLTNPGHPDNYIKTQCFSIPTAPDLAFWNANCDPAPPSVGAPVAPLSCFNLRGQLGRNSLIGPGIMALDFSVFKNNRIKRISETFNIQFRVEMFNILNHPNFAPPGPGDGNTDIFDATGTSLAPSATNPGGTAGVLVRTTIPERQIQFAIKATF